VQESYDIATLSEQVWREYEGLSVGTSIAPRRRSLP
jgi:hypothetical protein